MSKTLTHQDKEILQYRSGDGTYTEYLRKITFDERVELGQIICDYMELDPNNITSVQLEATTDSIRYIKVILDTSDGKVTN